jgi:hypothetical protein
MWVRDWSGPEGRVCLGRFLGVETLCSFRDGLYADYIRPCEVVPSAGLETRTTAGLETGATDVESCGLRIRQQNRFIRLPWRLLRG